MSSGCRQPLRPTQTEIGRKNSTQYLFGAFTIATLRPTQTEIGRKNSTQYLLGITFMKIEIEVPDLLTLVEFKRNQPDGVTVSDRSTALHGADTAAGVTKVIIDFGVQVGSGVVVGLILAAFAKYSKKHPHYKPRINRRETRLEHTEIFRIIEEERTTQDSDED
jgi:hypothetical protein